MTEADPPCSVAPFSAQARSMHRLASRAGPARCARPGPPGILATHAGPSDSDSSFPDSPAPVSDTLPRYEAGKRAHPATSDSTFTLILMR